MLGNDVVDLQEARALAKERDERFLARVFTAEERACISRATDSALALWMIWAAKESLFKIASREDPASIFAHQKFVSPALDSIMHARGGLLAGEVAKFRYEWNWDEEQVHCVVGSRTWETKVAATSDLSAGARSLALQILAIPGARIERAPGTVRAQAPVFWLGSETLPASVSLSHDGRFAAAAVAR